ncbi:HNH endonuclease [Polaromonas sp. P1(28)-8]|nr:HNH endonuclease [Polaromonas sp. P1(28)-8]
MDDHHIVYRQLGGSDALSNRVLLHPICHRRVHALGLKVIKPVPGTGTLIWRSSRRLCNLLKLCSQWSYVSRVR